MTLLFSFGSERLRGNMKTYLINLLLILIILFLMEKNYREWTSPLSARQETARLKQKTKLPVSSSTAGKKEMPASAVFQSISNKNIFSPGRKEFPVSVEKLEIGKPAVRPNLQLFGVAVGTEFRWAIINNPSRRAERGERETIAVREGDRVGEYKVATITEERITLESPGDSFDLLLYDPAKQKKRPAVAATTTPSPPTPTPPSISTTATTPPRLYTPPAKKDLPGKTMTRPQIQRRTIPSAPARTLPVPGANEEDDSNDDES